MAKNRRKKDVAFGELSCRRRKRTFITYKNLIRENANQFGGLYWSPTKIGEDAWWVDCWFIGKNKTLYNASLHTARWSYLNAVRHKAIEAARLRSPDDEWMTFEDSPGGRSGGRIIFNEGNKELFDGLGRFEWIRQEERRIAENREVSVFEQATLHRDYAEGVGFHAIVDVPVFTVKNVEFIIREFLANAEKPFVSNKPICLGYDQSLYAETTKQVVLFDEDEDNEEDTNGNENPAT